MRSRSTTIVFLSSNEHLTGKFDRILHILEQHTTYTPLPVAIRYHDAGFELYGSRAGENGAFAAVEEWVVLQEGDGVDGDIEGCGIWL
jgi:hypothetical protein